MKPGADHPRAGRAETESARRRPNTSPLLSDLIVRLLDDEPDKRPPDADAVLDQLNDARTQDDAGTSART
jgi:hypothetical protein